MCSCQQAKHAAEAAREFPAQGPPILGCRMHGWSSWQLAQSKPWDFLFSGLVLRIPSFGPAVLIREAVVFALAWDELRTHVKAAVQGPALKLGAGKMLFKD